MHKLERKVFYSISEVENSPKKLIVASNGRVKNNTIKKLKEINVLSEDNTKVNETNIILLRNIKILKETLGFQFSVKVPLRSLEEKGYKKDFITNFSTDTIYKYSVYEFFVSFKGNDVIISSFSNLTRIIALTNSISKLKKE